MAKTKLNPMTDKPTNKLQLSKDFMEEYIKTKPIAERKAYFSVVKNNTKDDKTDWKEIKNWFAEQYFSYLNEKKSKSNYLDDLYKRLGLDVEE